MKFPGIHGLLLAALAIFWGGSLFYVAIHALPYNPLVQSKSTEINLKFIMPEGWAFFTKNPREPRMKLYQIGENDLTLMDRHNASPENLWGLSRRTRVTNVELGNVVPHIMEDNWHDLDNALAVPAALDTIESIALVNEARDPRLCGSYCLVKYEPLPWAWSQDMQEDEMPVQIVKIDLLCL